MKNVLTGIKETIEDNATAIITVGTITICTCLSIGSSIWGLREYRKNDRRMEAIAEAVCRTKSW